ncbi:MAG: PrgI family protein [Candidatus Berkelbacteria bacterium]|nr:PrgI family protein [Candidatus Berkelbacteria bacterium]
MQYKVPQNIDLEDKIVGPFTMKQFIYVIVAGGIIYAWWSYLSNNYVDFMPAFLIFAVPVGFLGFCLALVKVNERPFEFFLLNLLRFIFSPKRRVWQEGYKTEDVIVVDKTEAAQPRETSRDTRSLDDLSVSLEKQAGILRQQELTQKPAAEKPGFLAGVFGKKGEKSESTLNLSVKDVKEAAQKQSQAQTAPKVEKTPPAAVGQSAAPKRKSGGLFGFMKK